MHHFTGTVLVVDDDCDVLELAALMVERAGARVLKASSGEEALQIFEAHQNEVELVISDVVMPEMFGDQLIKKLMARKPGLNYILMSGNPLGSLETEVELVQGQNFLQKPFELDELRQILRTHSVFLRR